MKNTKNKVLVAGGAGYIGGYTTDLLIKKGYDVTVFDNLLYEDRYLKNVRFIYGDIRDTAKFSSIAKNYDIVIFLSAIVGDPACKINLDLTEEINFNAVKNFCEEIKYAKNRPHIIYFSTCSVFGAQEGILNEQSSTNPLSEYASTKLRSEPYVLDVGGTIFRLGTIFGLGDSYSRIRLDLVVNVLTMKAIKTGKITVNGGDQWRPIIAVKDVAEYVAEACEKKPNDTFILSYKNTTIKELGEKIAYLVPGTIINYIDMNFQDARNYKVDTTKADNYFNFKAKTTIEEEVLRMKKIFEENRIKNTDLELYNNGFYLQKLKEFNSFV